VRGLGSLKFDGRAVRVTAYSLLIAAALIWLVGFVQFVISLPRDAAPPLSKSDGIVMLTGGPDRLSAAMALLSAGMANRLLVSGVHAETSRDDLRALVESDKSKFDCCVDLDWAAQNTEGNAIETSRWANKNGYQSLIIVTAGFHMPRSMLEMRRAMPNVDLTPFPVFPERAPIDDWWFRPGTARLLMWEYTKYATARIQSFFGGA
jgi:uncharacterized SAM-binding protein YcdF (DUF218 family)